MDIDDFDLDLEVELEESTVEVGAPLKIKSTIGVKFLKNDPLLNDKAIKAVESEGSVLALGNSNKEGTLRIEGGMQEEETILLLPPTDLEIDDVDIEDTGVYIGGGDIDDIEVDENPYELVLAGKTTTALAVQTITKDIVTGLYPRDENELMLIENQCKTVHDFIYRPSRFIVDMNKQIRAYLDQPQFNVFPKKARFQVNEMASEGDYRTLIKKQFNNIIGGSQDLLGLTNVVINAYEVVTRKDIDQEMIDVITNLMEDFVRYAMVKHETAHARFREFSYVRNYDEVKMPALISNFAYSCECGGSAMMHEERPTLCFLIQGNSDNVFIINEPVQCNSCGEWMALTNSLAEAIQYNANSFIGTGSRYKENRIYRPTIADLKNIIPADVADLFELDTQSIVNSELAGNNKLSLVGVTYKRLINMWMANQESSFTIKEAVESFPSGYQEQKLVDILAYAQFDKIPELEAYQITKSIVHYLENFSLFALTPERKMLYETYAAEGYNKEAFSDEFAIEWIDNNAAHLAGINNIFQGDMELGSLVLLPQFYNAINRVVMLHLLANKDKLEPGKEIMTWLNNPSADVPLTKKLDNISKGKDHPMGKRKPSINTRLVSNKRGFRDSGIVHPLEAWSDLHHFLNAVGKTILDDYNPTDEEIAVIESALSNKREDFYGIEEDLKLLVQETLMFDTFVHFFKTYGFLLFTGLILDETRRNLAMYISLMEHTPAGRNDLNIFFKRDKVSNVDVSSVLWSKHYSKSFTQEELDLKRLEMVLESTDLPGTLNDYREQYGVKDLMENFEEFKDQFQTDDKFMSKYGEALSCFW